MKKILIAFLLFIFTAPAMALVITGTVLDASDKQPLIEAGICVKDTNVCVISDFDGNFSLTYDDDLRPNAIIKISSIGYKDKEFIPDKTNTNIGDVLLEPENIELEEVTVEAQNKCNTDTEKNRLHASKARFIDTGKTITYKAGQTINGKEITENTTVNESICIPTECINNNYILENPDTPNAVCTDCKTLLSYSTSAHAAGNSCVADTCQKNFKVTNGKCVVDCSAPDVLKSLHATGATPKLNAVLPTQITRNFDFTKYCYPTECGTPRYEKRGTGEATTCFDLNNTSCAPTDTAHAQNGTYELRNNKLLCKPNCIGSNYTAKLNETKTDYYCAIKKDRSNEPCTNADIHRLKQAKKLDEHATKGNITEWDDKDSTVLACSVTECETGWEPNVEKTACVSTDGTDCTSQIDNAKSAKLQKGKCILDSCHDWYKVNSVLNKCEDQHNKNCPDSLMRSKYPDAQSATISEFKNNTATKCDIKKCKDITKTPSADAQSCVAVCSLGEQARLEAAGAAETTTKKGVCIAKSCKCGYTLEDGACRKWNGNNEPCGKMLPNNVSSGYMACDPNNDKGTPYCHITACTNSSYKPVNQGTKDNACVSTAGDTCNAYTAGDAFAVDSDDSGVLKRSGNQVNCVSQACIDHFNVSGNRCTLDCSTYLDDDENYHKFIGAKTLKQTSGILPRGRDDYSAYCYPTSCKTPHYNLVGRGEAANCESTSGNDCKSQIPHATVAYYDENHVCQLESCDEANGYTDNNNKCVDRVDDNCDRDDLQKIDHAASGTYERKNGKFVCHPKCADNFTDKWNGTKYICEMTTQAGVPCSDAEFEKVKSNTLNGYDYSHAVGGNVVSIDENGNVTICNITRCETGYTPNKNNTQCNTTKCTCEQKWSDTERKCVALTNDEKVCKSRATATTPALPLNAATATRTCDKDDDKTEPYCKITKCKDETYTRNDNNNTCDDLDKTTCKEADWENIEHAKGGTYDRRPNGTLLCKPECDGANYEAKLNTNKTAYICAPKTKSRVDKPCTSADMQRLKLDPNATKAVVADDGWDEASGTVKICIITDCKSGYEPDKDGKKCISTKCTTCGEEWDEKKQKCVTWAESGNTECTANSTPRLPANATEATKTCDNGKAICKISACAVNYTLNQNTNSCVSSRGLECEMGNPDSNAAVTTLHRVNGALICQIDACKTGYDVNKSKTACIARNVASKQEVKELKEKAAQMKEKENSLANRTVGAAGIAATGIGGAMIGAALSEQRLDAAAEGAMRAYIETFRCEYGDGKNVQGGETDVTLPGGNDMFNLYTQYANLANDLKIRKAALGLKPGIESEVVIDKADTGLYDDVGTGITGGNYASVARALMNPDGADAAAWNEQKNKTADTLKAGAITAGVGAAGSLAANIAVNSNKDKQKQNR